MLVVRNLLLLSFAANGLGDPEVNLALITTMVLCFIQAFMWLSDKVLQGSDSKYSRSNFHNKTWNFLNVDYFHTLQQSRSSSWSNDCCLHNHNNHCHHFHSHSMLPHLDRYHNITNCQESHQETSQTTGRCSTGRCSTGRLY